MGMSYSSDGKSARLTSSGEVYAGPGRVRLIHWLEGSTAGTITVRDGGATGTVVAVIDTAGAESTDSISLDEAPLRCETSIYVEFDQAVGVTVFYN